MMNVRQFLEKFYDLLQNDMKHVELFVQKNIIDVMLAERKKIHEFRLIESSLPSDITIKDIQYVLSEKGFSVNCYDYDSEVVDMKVAVPPQPPSYE